MKANIIEAECGFANPWCENSIPLRLIATLEFEGGCSQRTARQELAKIVACLSEFVSLKARFAYTLPFVGLVMIQDPRARTLNRAVHIAFEDHPLLPRNNNKALAKMSEYLSTSIGLVDSRPPNKEIHLTELSLYEDVGGSQVRGDASRMVMSSASSFSLKPPRKA